MTTKEQRKDAFSLAYWYDKEARQRLIDMGITPPDQYLLVEGAGKIVFQRIKRYGKEQVMGYLKRYLDSNKFEDYPMLRVALDSHTLTNLQMDKEI